ncbi:hypothetical protein [Parasitella parasitica]|uniref:Tip elongation aberrant protein 1 n=1 Tax=Parasitella parasitica TaxID=35722 RepID=A0A0B7MY25_9FUNG|nr:hypothetical protein [Parasitella parasitica]
MNPTASLSTSTSTSSSPGTRKSKKSVYGSRSNSFSATSQSSVSYSIDNNRQFDSSTFQRAESPTLPPEDGKVHDTLISSNSMLNDNSRYLKLNLTKSNISSTGSSEMGPASPTSTIHATSYQMQQQLEDSTNRIQNRQSRSKSRHGQPTAVTSNVPKSRSVPKSNVNSSNKTPDHLAAAIELSTTNALVAPTPAAGMYWSRTLTYGRNPSRPLRAHTANLIGEKLYVFGGCDTSLCFNTLYILDMGSQQGPPPCRAHSCTVVERDSGSGRRSHQLYIFGGGNGPDYFQDVYVLDADTLVWSKPNIELDTRPSKRRAHTTCLWEDKIIVIGGGDGARALDDVHMLDISNPHAETLRWEKLETSGAPPPARGYHTSNLVKDKLIVFGGSDGHDCFEDVHVLDLVKKKWSQIDLDRKIPRLAHTSTQVGSYVFVIGGHDGRRYSQDVLLFNLVTMSWEARKVYGAAPNPRGYHTTVLYDSRLYVLGGYDGKNVFDDVHMLELSACAYLPQITNFEIDV